MTTNGRSAAGPRPCGPSATPSTARPLPMLRSERAVATGCAAVAAVHGSGWSRSGVAGREAGE
eukprot:48670-Prymnesium_polylepis.1